MKKRASDTRKDGADGAAKRPFTRQSVEETASESGPRIERQAQQRAELQSAGGRGRTNNAMKINRRKGSGAGVNSRQRGAGRCRGRPEKKSEPITALIVPSRQGRGEPIPTRPTFEIVPRDGGGRVGTVLSEITWEYVAYRYLGLGIHEVPVEGKNVLRLSLPRTFGSKRTGIRDLLGLDLVIVYRRPGVLGLVHTHLLPQYFGRVREEIVSKSGMSDTMFDFTYVRSARRAEFDSNERLCIGESLSPVLGCLKVMKVAILPWLAVLEIVGPTAPEAAMVASALTPCQPTTRQALPACTVA